MPLASRTLLAVTAYAATYAASLGWLSRSPLFQAGESLAVLLTFGVGYSVVAWWVTRRISAQTLEVRSPRAESLWVLGYLAVFSMLFLGMGLSWLKSLPVAPATRDVLVLVAKLATMAALPAWLLMRRGYPLRELVGTPRFDRCSLMAFAIMAALLMALQLLAGRAVREVANLGEAGWVIALAVPAAWLWTTFEAGVTEEFLFRVALQTRLAAWLRSESAGIVLMALLFGLAHAPGYVLRGGHAAEGMLASPDALTAMAYGIVAVSPVGLLFGVLWARTRNFWLLAVLHGWVDLVPFLPRLLSHVAG